MRKLIFIFLFFALKSNGQVYQAMTQYGYDVKRMNFDSTLQIPTVCGVPTLKSLVQTKKAAIAFDSCNKRFYFYNPKTLAWDTIKGGGSSTDTTSLSNRIDNKVPYLNAISDVDLGAFSLNAKSVKINGTNGNGHIDLRHQASDASATGQTTALFANSNGDLKWKNDNKYYTTLTTQQSADRVYTFQNKSYTLGDSADISLRVKYTDTASMLSPYVRTTTLTEYLQKSDSTIYQTKYGVDTARINIYNGISSKFTLPSLTSGSVLFSNGTTISQNNSNLFWDNSNTRLGIGTSSPGYALDVQGSVATTAGNIVTFKNTNASLTTSPVLALDCSGTQPDQPVDIRLGSTQPKGLRLYASNADLAASPAGAGFQFFNIASTNFPGQIYFDGGAHNNSSIIFRTAQTSGNIAQRMRIFANGNVSVSSSATDAGFLLNVAGTGRFTAALTTAGKLSAFVNKTTTYTITATDEVIYADATSGAFTVSLPTAGSRGGQTYTIKRANAGANNVTVGTTSSQTIDGATTYVLSAQYKYVTVVSTGTAWIIVSNN